MLYDVRYLNAGNPRRIRIEAANAAAAVEEATLAAAPPDDPAVLGFELLSVIPAAVRISVRS